MLLGEKLVTFIKQCPELKEGAIREKIQIDAVEWGTSQVGRSCAQRQK